MHLVISLTDSSWACSCARSSLNFSSSAFDASKFNNELDKLLSSSERQTQMLQKMYFNTTDLAFGGKNKLATVDTLRSVHGTHNTGFNPRFP